MLLITERYPVNMRVFERADYAIYRSEDDLASPVERRDGSVVFECIAARAGILAYPSDSGGSVKYERVTVDTLKSMVPSMQFAYVTKGHPTDSDGRLLDVTPENVRELSYGQCCGVQAPFSDQVPMKNITFVQKITMR